MSTYDFAADTSEKCMTSMKRSGKLAVAVLGVVLGVALLLYGNHAKKSDSDPTPTSPPEEAEIRSVEEYRLALERRIADISATVAGAGHVSVVVTLEGGYEYVYATDTKVTVGGESHTYITVGSGSDESLVFITERAPAILGVGIVCTGGGSADVRRELTSLISAAFGVPSNKIYVAVGK